MHFPTKILTIVAVLLASVIVSCVLIAKYIEGKIETDCTLRATTFPEVPLYPGSTLVEKKVTRDTPGTGGVWYAYAVKDSLANVLEFYKVNTGCMSDGSFCSGSSKPFGKYSVRMWQVTGTSTSYAIDISWDRCGKKDWEQSIE